MKVRLLRLCLTVCMGLTGSINLSALAVAAERRSGTSYMGPELQAMQQDDAANPATLSVLDGADLWRRPAVAQGKSCADCHGNVDGNVDANAGGSMAGVAARYPAFDAGLSRPLTLDERINTCRTRHQQAAAFAPEHRDLLALSAFLSRQSRGMSIAPPADQRVASFAERGRAVYDARQGQLNLSCAICHDWEAGKRLAGTPIPEAHPTAYPIYRLEWQGMGSLQRRLRNCFSGMRADVPAYGDQTLLELEVFLMQRAAGMTHEGPGVRP